MRITDKVRRLVDEYLIDLNATKAAIRAGYSERTAKQIASEVLNKPEVQALLQERQAALAERTEITQDAVLQRLWAIATADPSHLMQFRRTCCRHCWGKKFGYQRTAQEMKADRVSHQRQMLEKRAEADRSNQQFMETPFDQAGGTGYDARKDPNPKCPECFGQGHGNAFFEDTRKLQGNAKFLYAGVKQGKEGLEVKTLDPIEALKLVGQHLGMFKTKVEHSGPDGGPIEQKTTVVDEQQVRAALDKFRNEY
ncbi:terminase small subunit [Herbaspirillum frisingense]|uniref:terminase small subunit n=1 Tax=Herbaspirillum frisingense TaxID=92645 RepID=UPI001603603C|nr:terminase small subunit [Herbaspirillum frisingense]QNB08349.1 terminase small subunit [Herbaspirillum frisingense]